MKRAAACCDQQRRVKRRIIQWIIWYLNAKRFPGLQWVDKKSGLFKTSCIHERSKLWDPQLVEHYGAWARYKKHPKKKNRSLKAAFRTSLNSKVKSGEVLKGKKEKCWAYWRIKKEFLDKYLCEEKENLKFDDENNGENPEQGVSSQPNNQQSLPPETSKEIRDASNKGKKPTSSNKVKKPRQKQQKNVKLTAIQDQELLEGSSSRIPFPKSQDVSCRIMSPPSFPPDYWNQPTPPSQSSDNVMENNDVMCGIMSPPRFSPDYWNQPTPPSQPSDIVLENTENKENSFYNPCLDFSSQLSPPLLPTKVVLENEQEQQWQPLCQEYTPLMTPPQQSWDTNENNASFSYSSPSYSLDLPNPPLHHYEGFNFDSLLPTNTPSSLEFNYMQHPPTMHSSKQMQPLLKLSALLQNGNIEYTQYTPDCEATDQDQLIKLPQEVMIRLEDFFF